MLLSTGYVLHILFASCFLSYSDRFKMGSTTCSSTSALIRVHVRVKLGNGVLFSSIAISSTCKHFILFICQIDNSLFRQKLFMIVFDHMGLIVCVRWFIYIMARLAGVVPPALHAFNEVMGDL